MPHNILIFGGTGMLGAYCTNVLQQHHTVHIIDRNTYNIIDNDYDKLFNIIHSHKTPIIINCAGLIPQRHSVNDFNYFIVNSLFPKMLEKIAVELDLKFIHMSTNCVFNYENGNNNELKMPNETNPYGLSKILGEPETCAVIRTSIIGEEIVNKKSFLEWVISNKNGKIDGYNNYLWNGCTCLAVAKYIEKMIETNSYWKGIKHLHSNETVSKYQLANYVNEIYELDIKITPIDLEMTVNKTLSSIYDNVVINKSIKEQIIEQKNVDLKLGTYSVLKKCRCCNNSDLTTIWKLQNAPLAGGFLKQASDIIYERHYPLTLLYCEYCYSAFVEEIVKENQLFTNINNNGYFYYSSQIPTLMEHFKNLYEYVKTKYVTNEKTLLEIGCNDGVFLNNFNKADALKNTIGIDPSETIHTITNPEIIKINDFFNSETTTRILSKYGKMDIIVACNCLAHIDNISDIFKNLKLLLKDDGVIIMEVHYVKNICEFLNFDFIYHEHMSYYSINGIHNICKHNNLYLDNIEHITNHGGSIRITIKQKLDDSDVYHNPLLTNTLQQEDITVYMETLLNRIDNWKTDICSLIDNVYKTEQIIAGYGASGRTNILMTVTQKRFDFIFDDSISKINNLIPLFHTQILNSSEIYNNNIKTVFILAWPYSKYIIQKHLKFIENGGRFIIILPEIKEINISNYLDN